MPATANDQLRDQLKGVRAEIDKARDEKATAVAARDQAKQAFIDAGLVATDPSVQDKQEWKDGMAAVKAAGEAEDRLADLQATEGSLLGMLGESTPDSRGGNGPGSPDAEDLRSWDGHRLLAGDSYQHALDAGLFTSTEKFGSVNLGEIASREQFQGFLAAVDSLNKIGATKADRRGFVQPLLKPLTLLDIIPTGTTDSNLIEYVQVVNVPAGAVETAEGAAKPELGLTTLDATAPVRTIPGYVKLNRQALDDIATLGSLINSLLPYEVKRRIEAQILAGDGAGQNLKGILNQTGLGAPAFVAGDNAADAILRAITTIIMSDGDPNFVALNPLTWRDILLMREDTAGAGTRTGGYIFGSPAMQTAPQIWGLASTPNRAVPQATPLVGDANGAMLLIREGVNVRVSDSDQDDFTKNRVTVLAEARVALPVWRPASFAKAALS